MLLALLLGRLDDALREPRPQAGGGDVTDALASTLAAVQGFLAPPLMYLDPRGGTQPLSGLSMRPSIQQAGLHNMPGVQMPASFAEAVANGVNARAQRMSVNVAAGRPMPATMGDANAEANVPGGGVEAFRLGVRWGLGHSIGMVANSAITTPFTPSVNHSRTGRRRHDTADGDLERRAHGARDVW